MDLHSFHGALGQALEALDRAHNAEERAKAAEKRVEISGQTLDAHRAEMDKRQRDTDAKIAKQISDMVIEKEMYIKALTSLKAQLEAFQIKHSEQMNSAGSELTDIKTAIGAARSTRDLLHEQLAKLRSQISEMVSKF